MEPAAHSADGWGGARNPVTFRQLFSRVSSAETPRVAAGKQSSQGGTPLNCRYRVELSRILVAALVVCTTTPPALSQSLTAKPGTVEDLGGLLSRPLPGTPERADADFAAALRDALLGFDGVEDASVVISRSSAPDPPHRSAAIRLALAPDHAPTREWVAGLATFIVGAERDLSPDALTIVSSSGAVLYSRGEVTLSEPERPREPLGRATWQAHGAWLLGAGAFACMAVLAVTLLRGSSISSDSPSELQAPPAAHRQTENPLGFLATLTDDGLRAALADERPEVVAAVVAEVDEETAERVTALLNAELPPLLTTTPPEITAALAQALETKLAVDAR